MFLGEGIPTVILGVVTLFYLTEWPHEAHWLEPVQRDWLEAEIAADRERVGDTKHPAAWTVAGDLRVWSLSCLFGCALVGIYGLFFWLPQIVKSLGNLSTLQVGFLSAVPPLAGVLGTIIIGRSSNRLGERKQHLAFVYAMSAISIAGSAFAPNPVLAYLLLCLTALFIYDGNPLFWALAANDLIHRLCTLFPRHFVGVCQLPQAPGVAPANCIPELRRCVEQLGFIGCNLNPDPSGGYWTDPPLTDRWWYPLYEVMVELDVPAMIHVSSSCNPNFHATGAHYINGDITAFMQFLTAELFRDFPALRFIIPHGGSAVPYHWGRYRGLAQDMGKPRLRDYLLRNVFFDTCVYHQPGTNLLAQVIPVENILFASETIGAVQGIDPETGHHYDDTKRYIDAVLWLTDEDRSRVYEHNARRVYRRLSGRIELQARNAGAAR